MKSARMRTLGSILILLLSGPALVVAQRTVGCSDARGNPVPCSPCALYGGAYCTGGGSSSGNANSQMLQGLSTAYQNMFNNIAQALANRAAANAAARAAEAARQREEAEREAELARARAERRRRIELDLHNRLMSELSFLGDRAPLEPTPLFGGAAAATLQPLGVDDDPALAPAGTSFFGVGGGNPAETAPPVNLSNLRRAAFLAEKAAKAAPEDAAFLIDEAVEVANNKPPFVQIPEDAVPVVSEDGLRAFQQANIDYRRAHADSVQAAQRVAELDRDGQIAAEVRRHLQQDNAAESALQREQLAADAETAVRRLLEEFQRASRALTEAQGIVARADALRRMTLLAMVDPKYKPAESTVATLGGDTGASAAGRGKIGIKGLPGINLNPNESLEAQLHSGDIGLPGRHEFRNDIFGGKNAEPPPGGAPGPALNANEAANAGPSQNAGAANLSGPRESQSVDRAPGRSAPAAAETGSSTGITGSPPAGNDGNQDFPQSAAKASMPTPESLPAAAPSFQQAQGTAALSVSGAQAAIPESAAALASQPFDNGVPVHGGAPPAAQGIPRQGSSTIGLSPPEKAGEVKESGSSATAKPSPDPLSPLRDALAAASAASSSNSLAISAGPPVAVHVPPPAVMADRGPRREPAIAPKAKDEDDDCDKDDNVAAALRRANVYRAGGISPNFGEAFCAVATSSNQVIIFNQVNPSANERLREGAVPKPMWIKAKTSEQQPISGYVPRNPALSKTPQAQWGEMTKAIEACYRNFQELEMDCRSQQVSAVAAQECVKTALTLAPATGRCYVDLVTRNNVEVLADPLTKQPITADYDLLALGPKSDPGPVLNLPSVGAVTLVGVGTIGALNAAANNPSGPIVQHGAAADAPCVGGRTDGKPSYPATAIAPGKRKECGCRVSGIADDSELRSYFVRMEAESFHLHENECWGWSGTGSAGKAAPAAH